MRRSTRTPYMIPEPPAKGKPAGASETNARPLKQPGHLFIQYPNGESNPGLLAENQVS